MKRFFLLLTAFATVAASCGGTSVTETSAAATANTNAPATTQQEESPTTSADQTATSAAIEEDAPPEGPPAKDFTLALEPDGEFVLSQEVKPVYMVFWAEW